MAYNRPRSSYQQQRGQLAGYQYRNMNRYVPRQIRSWAQASGNPYKLSQWRQGTPSQLEQRANADYFNNKLMQRLGGDLSLRDRMIPQYYNPQQLPEAWRNAPTWQPGMMEWMKRRLQGDTTAMGQTGWIQTGPGGQGQYGWGAGGSGGWGEDLKPYTGPGSGYGVSNEAAKARAGLL